MLSSQFGGFYSRIYYFKFHRILIFFAISCPFSDVKQINGIFEIKNWQKKDANFEAIQIAPDAVYFLESCQNLCFLWPNTAIYFMYVMCMFWGHLLLGAKI